MTDVIFARPRYGYDSYSDLYRLIELSGYPLVFVDQVDVDQDVTYIATIYSSETAAGWRPGRARVLLLDMEWHMDWHTDRPQIPGVSGFLAPDRWYAQHIGAGWLPLGSHPGLREDWPAARGKVYDVAAFMYWTHRRALVRDAMLSRGMGIAPNGWGAGRHEALCTSRAMLHVHQHEAVKAIAPLRTALAAAYSLPLIAETPFNKNLLSYSTVLCSDHRNMADFVYMWTRRNDGQALQNYGDALHRLLCHEWTFRRGVNSVI